VDDTQSTREALAKLAAFAPRMRQPAASFGCWPVPEIVKPALPVGFEPSALCSEFVRMAYNYGWILKEFDWPAWAHGPEGQRLANDRCALQNASPDELAKMLTACVRQDRFVDGALAKYFASGILLAITERAEILVSGA
jgi:Family of unknown function (DUF6508)